MPKLSPSEIETKLKDLPGWSLQEGALVRDWEFADFVQAMTFVNHVAQAAEAADHHPDIDIRYNKVRLALVTHSSGGITDKDASMAGQISQIG